MKFFLVVITTIITVITALLLDYSAKNYSILHSFSIAILLLVIVINFIKFKLWGFIHKKFDLSKSYPAVAIFFPIIYIVSIYKGDADFEISKVIAILFIVFGIYYMNTSDKGVKV